MGRRPELKSDENSEVPPLFHEISAVLHVKKLKRLMQSFVTRLLVNLNVSQHISPSSTQTVDCASTYWQDTLTQRN